MLRNLGILSYAIKKLTRNDIQYNGVRLVVFALLQLCSCLLTNKFGITIPRFNNALSAMLLIYAGQQIHQVWKWEFNNGYVALFCAILVYQGTVLMGNGSVGFNENLYNDMMMLTIGSVAALYVLCYISQLIESSVVGRLLNYIGVGSFYIMCLHIVGFHLCTELMIMLGILDGGRSDGMTPELSSFWLVIIYWGFGIITPLLIMNLIQRFKVVNY